MANKLGKGLKDIGLNELLSDLQQQQASPLPLYDRATGDDQLTQLAVTSLIPGKYQPRQIMDQGDLQELADSIIAQGIIQPIVVRPSNSQQFEIIAGERRWRAAQLAKLEHVPVIVRDIPDEAAIAMALIENIQRRDLTALEEAQALQRLMHEFCLTHQQVATAVGKSRSAITNLLRLLSLDETVQQLLYQHQLEMGHARALLSLPPTKQQAIARKIIAQSLSVRDTERLVKSSNEFHKPSTTASNAITDTELTAWQQELSEALGCSVSVKAARGNKAKLVLPAVERKQLRQLIDRLVN